jgi:hypothetical protein
MLKKLAALSLFVFLFSGTAIAVEFSAETITTLKGGHQSKGKIYFKQDRFRMELREPEEMIVITRIDKQVVWNVMPAAKMYLEMPFNIQNKPKVEEKFEGEIERKEVGRETIDGHPTIKYLITYKADDRKEQVYQWFATDIKFGLKTAAVDGSWTQEFRNVRMESQQDSIFELPSGYQKMQMPGMPDMPMHR